MSKVRNEQQPCLFPAGIIRSPPPSPDFVDGRRRILFLLPHDRQIIATELPPRSATATPAPVRHKKPSPLPRKFPGRPPSPLLLLCRVDSLLLGSRPAFADTSAPNPDRDDRASPAPLPAVFHPPRHSVHASTLPPDNPPRAHRKSLSASALLLARSRNARRVLNTKTSRRGNVPRRTVPPTHPTARCAIRLPPASEKAFADKSA